MRRRGKGPSYFRFLLPAVFAGLMLAFTIFVSKIDEVRCTFVPKQVVCPPMFPEWVFTVAFAFMLAMCLWSAWKCYVDHVQGQYEYDRLRWMDGSRDED